VRDVRLTEEQLVLARTQVDALHDAIYVLACAVEDAERDLGALGERPAPSDLREIVDWVIDNARPLLGLHLRPT